MYKFTDPKQAYKLGIDYSIDLEIIKPYYDLQKRFMDPNMKIDRFYHMKHEYFVIAQDFESDRFMSSYFQTKDGEVHSKEQIAIMQRMYLELFAIAYLYCENEWINYYKYIYNSYQRVSSNKTENYISKEITDLKEIINLLTISHSIERSDIRIRFKDEHNNVNQKHTVELNQEDRLLIIKSLLEKKLNMWQSKHLTASDLAYFKKAIGKKYVYKENSRIANILKKMSNITSQGIKFMQDVNNMTIDNSLDYYVNLLEVIKKNWSWDSRKSPLNTFNAKIIQAQSAYIDDKAKEYNDIFKIGARKYKELMMFSFLRILNMVPDNSSYDMDKPFDAKEDYIKDLLKLKV